MHYNIARFGAAWIAEWQKWVDPFDQYDPWETSHKPGKHKSGNRKNNFHLYFGVDLSHLHLLLSPGCAMGLRRRANMDLYPLMLSVDLMGMLVDQTEKRIEPEDVDV